MGLRFCFIDMDGVLADFVTGICEAHNKPYLYGTPDTCGIFEMEKLWGISDREFWKPSEREGFWANLAKYEDADALIDWACSTFGTDNVCILTAPSLHAHCVPEKREWIGKHYPKLKRNILFGSSKQFLAGPDRALVDDRDKNIEAFNQYGGVGLTWPQFWNRAYPHRDNRLGFVRTKAACYSLPRPQQT